MVFLVAPAEMEALLLQHPKIVDAAVIGVYSEEEATELPRFVPPFYAFKLAPHRVRILTTLLHPISSINRAYVVPKEKPQPGAESTAFSKEIQEWVRGRVAKHKFLRGGVVVIQQVPKSAAGKILRRQLRSLANAESGSKSKL